MSKHALEGIRVVDLSYSYAGPYLTRMLADMGAEVIKVESCRRPELTRPLILAENKLGDEWWDRAGYFNLSQRNKYGITLDLTMPRGRDILKELIKKSDILIEAYSPRVMPQLELDYPVIKELKEDIIMLSLSGYGQTGPYSYYASFGTVMESMSGITHLTGYPDGPPMKTGISYCDPITGLMGAGLVLAALHHKIKTGQGQYIDVSMYETGVSLIGDVIMDYSMNRRVAKRNGNRRYPMAPHGCYRCKGDDEWIAIAVSSDEEWTALSKAMGEPEWTKEASFASCLSRWENQQALDCVIEEWTKKYNHYEVMDILQKVGVAAGPVLTNKELLFDPHLKARKFFELIDHPLIGKRPYAGMAFRMSKTPGSIRRRAPLLGEHNEQILGGILGMSEGEIVSLEQEGVIGTIPLAAFGGLSPEEVLAVLAINTEKLLEVRAITSVDSDYLSQLGLDKAD